MHIHSRTRLIVPCFAHLIYLSISLLGKRFVYDLAPKSFQTFSVGKAIHVIINNM